MTPDILFEDTHLAVLRKPAGLLSQGAKPGDPNLVDWLRGHFGRNYVGLIHRLDRNTSGLMVVGKRSKSADRLTESLQSGDLVREYLALVQGEIVGEKRWEHYLYKNEADNRVTVFSKPTPNAKVALLTLHVEGTRSVHGEKLSLVRFKLETGRSHQIRAQAAFEGHPLVGDAKYGAKKLKEPFASFGRTALHSALLTFPHPMTREEMRFEDPLPEDMKRLWTNT